MLFKKPSGLKYTELCMYIDKNMEKLRNPGEYPEVENTVYNYLWLLVKALAIKKGMFSNFQDYDPYSFYAANRLFFALRKNLQNQGKTIKGKKIRPIKSSLNYTKALLYPMKIEYQRESFREVISEEFVSTKFDAFSYNEKLKDDARETLGVNEAFQQNVQESFQNCGELLDRVLIKSPFGKNSIEYKRLKMSLMLNCVSAIKTKKKLDANAVTMVLWKLPKSMSNYVRVLLKEFFVEMKKDIMDCYKSADIDDEYLNDIIANPTGESTNQDEE